MNGKKIIELSDNCDNIYEESDKKELKFNVRNWLNLLQYKKKF